MAEVVSHPDPGSVDRIRVRYRELVADHEVAWELTFAGLAVVFVILGFVDVAPEQQGLLEATEWTLTGLFAAEFATRLWAAADRRDYVRGHWIDLVALVPPVRALRVLRLARLLRLVRAFAGVARALGHVERLARHRGLIWIFVAWIAVMVLTSIGLYAAEKGVNAAVEDPLDALWWGVSTMTTVGYGDVYPTTDEGRLAAMALMLMGIGLFSAVTAVITSFVLQYRELEDRDPVAGTRAPCDPTSCRRAERHRVCRSEGTAADARADEPRLSCSQALWVPCTASASSSAWGTTRPERWESPRSS